MTAEADRAGTVGGSDWKPYKPARRDYWLGLLVQAVASLMSAESARLVRAGAVRAIRDRVAQDVEAEKVDAHWLINSNASEPLK